MLFLYFCVILASSVLCCFASNLEFAIDQGPYGRVTISGYFPDHENRTRRLELGISNPSSAGNLEFVVQTTNPSIGRLSLWVSSPEALLVDLSYGSNFSRTVGNMMLLPRGGNNSANRNGFRMITSVTNPASFCFDGSLIIVPLVENARIQPSISAELSLRLPGTNEVMPLFEPYQEWRSPGYYSESANIKFKTGVDMIRLPISIQRAVYIFLENEGYRLSHNNRIRSTSARCVDVIPRMPTIQISLMSNGDHVADVLLAGRDYIRTEDTGECHLLLRISDVGVQPEPFLGNPFFEIMAVLFDYTNNQIGICDPN